MDPERYYKYTDFGTVEQPAGVMPVEHQPEEADEASPDTVYLLDQLSQKRPGPVLLAGHDWTGLEDAPLLRLENGTVVVRRA